MEFSKHYYKISPSAGSTHTLLSNLHEISYPDKGKSGKIFSLVTDLPP